MTRAPVTDWASDWDHLDPAWKRISGGCHLNRAIATLVVDAGFDVERIRNSYMPGPRPMTYMYEGGARLL